MKLLSYPNRAHFAFVILFIAQMLLMSLHAHARASNKSLPHIISLTVLYPLQKGIVSCTSTFSKLWYGYIYLRSVSIENEKLKHSNAQLERELVTLREEAASSRRYSDLLQLKEKVLTPTITANVIARNGSLWFKQIIIDKGSIEGIKVNSPVMTPQGVVGKVIQVSATSSCIQLLTDGYSGFGVMLAESRANGEIHGNNTFLCKLDNISGLNSVREGEIVLTSGLDGIYPKGLMVGRVEQVQLGSGAAIHQISVKPAISIDKLEEVLVIVGKTDNLQFPEILEKSN